MKVFTINKKTSTFVFLKTKSVLKKTFHKILFIIPLLGLILLYTNGIKKSLIQQNKETSVVQLKKNITKPLHTESKTNENNENSYFFCEEIEDEPETDWLIINSFTETLFSNVPVSLKSYKKVTFFYKKKNQPFYDLFCNWKHHLS